MSRRNETPRQLPVGWRMVRVGDITKTCSGSTPSRSIPDYFVGDICWVKTSELKDGTIDSTEEHISERALKEISLRLLPVGTLLVAMYGQGQTRGRTGLLSVPATTNQACFAILPNPEIFYPPFLQFWFRLNYSRLRAETEGRGGNQPNLNGELLNGQEIPLPPLNEQKRISEILEEQLDSVNKARTSAKEQLEAIRALPSAFLRQAFTSNETSNRRRTRLGELLRLRKEVIYPRDNPTGKAIFVGLEHIESVTGRRTGSVELEKENLTGRKPRFYKGDIVYGYLRPYLNKLWVAEFDGLCSVDQYVYSVNTEQADTDFVAWFMRSPTYLSKAPIDSTPGQLPRIRTEEVATVEIDLPPLLEQKRIAEQLNAQMHSVESTREQIAEQLTAIERLPTKLLERAFKGQL